MLSLVNFLLFLFTSSGGGLLLNKNFFSNFIYIFSLMIVWLCSHTLLEWKKKSGVLLSIITSGIVLLSLKTKSLFFFYIFFEFSVVPVTLMVFLFGYQPEKLQAALFLLLYTVIGSLPLLLFLISMEPHLMISSLVSLSVTLGFMVKTPMFLLHTWLPKAHVEAPVGGSMILAGVLLKLGSYGLLLFLPYVKQNSLLSFYCTLSFLGTVCCSLYCMRQGDMKLLIAYSSVVHMGQITVGFVSGTEVGYVCGVMMVIGHGICSPFLFSMAYCMYVGTKSRLLLNNTSSYTFLNWIFFALITLNMAVPPSLNIWTEIMYVQSAIILFVGSLPLLLLGFFLSVLYNLYLYTSCSHSKYCKPYIAENYWVYHFLQVVMLGYCAMFSLEIFHI